MDPILQQLFAADPTLLDQVSAPPPSVTRTGPAPDPNALQFSPEFAQLAAPVAPAPSTPQASPSPVPAPMDPGAQGGPASSSQGVSVSRKAWSPDQAQAIEGFSGTQERKQEAKTLEGRIAQDDAAYRADTEALRQRGQAAIATSGELAARKAADEAEAGRKQAAEEMKVAADLQSFTDAAWTRVAQSQADFQAQLAAQRGMRIDPQAWYSDRSEGQKVRDALSSGIAMYWMASGKPAMAEVGKHILGNFDKQVERNIDAQIQNLKNQQEVSQGFMQAWQMASSNAVNEQEAKHRVHAMLLQAHKDQLTADIAAKYGSDQARAAAEMASVELDRGIQKDLQEATKERQKAELQLAGIKSQEYQTRLRVAQDDRRLAFDRAEADKAKGVGGPAALAKLGYFGVVNPETGELDYFTDSEKKQTAANEVLDNGRKLQKTLADLRSAIRDAGGDKVIGGIKNWSQLKNSKDLKVAGLATVAAYQLAKTVDPQGRAVTDSDFDNMVPVTGILGLASLGDGEESRTATANLLENYTQGGIRQLAYDMTPDVRATFQAYGMDRGGAQKPALPAHSADVNAKPPVTTPTDSAAAIFKTPGAREVDWVPATEADNQWLIYATEGGKLDGKPARPKSVTSPDGQSVRVKQPGWADELSLLDLRASDPKVPEAERVQARTKLMEIKAMKEAENVDAAYFAKWLLDN